MVKKRHERVKITAIMNNRFLLACLKTVCHGKISTSNLTLINNFFTKVIDIEDYQKDLNIYVVVVAIKTAVECKMSKIDDVNTIMGLVRSEITDETMMEILDDSIEPTIITSCKVTDNEMRFIIEKISTYSKYNFILQYKSQIIDKIIQIETGNTQDVVESISQFMKMIKSLNNRLHKTASIDSNALTETVSMNDPEFLNKHFEKLYEMSKRKTKCLKTGIKKFNEMCGEDSNGGLYTGKMYCFHAPTNSFKTAFLLHLAKWIRMYNSDEYMERFKETGRIPTILFVSLENTWDENLDRLYSMVTGKDISKATSIEEAKKTWVNEDSNKSIIDICMVYAKANRFSPMDLEAKIEELESTENREVICCILDYMKNMKDDLGDRDPRIKLINVSKDLYDMTTLRPNMCMITAHHTNREADRLISEMKRNGTIDMVKSLGREHLTESNAAEEALDFSFYILPEQSPFDKEWYLGIKLGKTRKKRSLIEYIAHPLRNRFYLMDDYKLNRSLSLYSIGETVDGGAGAVNTLGSGNPRENKVNPVAAAGRTSARSNIENKVPGEVDEGFIDLGL